MIPICVGLLGRDGRDLPLRLKGETCEPASTYNLILNRESDTWVFENINENPVISIGRGFSAPVIFDYNYTTDELAFLALNDSDPFNRAEAFERLALATINRVADQMETGVDPDVPEIFLSAFGGIFNNAQLSPEYRAAVLTMPTEKAIGRRRALINPDVVRRALVFVTEAIGRRFSQDFNAADQSFMLFDEYKPTHHDAGYRAISNVGLHYWLAGGNAKALLSARDRFENANNLTDRLAALKMIANSQSPAKIDVLNAAVQMWAEEPLLINKWFTVQATAMSFPNEAPVVDRIRTLMQYDIFSEKNPNNVYALVVAFMTNNEAEFHRPDGSGYDFWVEMVLRLDRINPHVAARCARALDNWRRYTPDRARLMHDALVKVAETPELSRAVREVITKALNNN